MNFTIRLSLQKIGEDDLNKILNAITESASTGAVGDGKIFIYDVADVLRIRTGEKGRKALL